MVNTIDAIDVRQECITETLTFTSTFDESSDIGDGDLCQYPRLWIEHVHQLLEPSIWYVNLSSIGINGTERIVLSWHREL